MISPPDKNLSDRKFTLWIIVILIFLTFQFVLTMTGHRMLSDQATANMVAETTRECRSATATR